MKWLIALVFLTGCATTAPEPIIVTQRVNVPVRMPCIPENYSFERPDYVDSDEALKRAFDAADRYQLLWAGRAQRIKREAENEIVIGGCR